MSKNLAKENYSVNMQKRIEVLGIVIIAAASIIVPLLDFIGALDSLSWLSQRIPTMTLLAVGGIALYMLSQNHTGIKSIESMIKDNNEIILQKLSSEKANQKLLDSLEGIWNERENDLQKIFRQAKLRVQKGNVNALKEYLKEQEELIEKGQVFETRLKYAWDINIAMINSEGNYVHHFTDDMIFRRQPPEHPNWEILRMRNGSLLWVNTDRGKFSKRLNLFPKNLRFTKIYFQELPKLDVILIIQSHINILPDLPLQP